MESKRVACVHSLYTCCCGRLRASRCSCCCVTATTRSSHRSFVVRKRLGAAILLLPPSARPRHGRGAPMCACARAARRALVRAASPHRAHAGTARSSRSRSRSTSAAWPTGACAPATSAAATLRRAADRNAWPSELSRRNVRHQEEMLAPGYAASARRGPLAPRIMKIIIIIVVVVVVARHQRSAAR
eukprot:scaffold3183_cov381-Prasinococcus_capsulatus_cf.AAC.23